MRALTIGMMALVLAGIAFAQAPAPSDEAADDVMKPTSHGVRMTPGLARAITRAMARNGVLTGAFGLEESQSDEAAEKIARRIMTAAHKDSEMGQQFFEYAMEALIENNGRFTPETGKRWAELSKPLVPHFREMMTGIAQDVREMLPPAKQAGFAGKMLAMSMAIDAYEKRMDRWLEGKVDENENPFDDPKREERRKAEASATSNPGESREMREARQRTEREMDRAAGGGWRDYVNRAAEYYNFTEAQKQSAESILREVEERASQVKNEEWKVKAMANRMKRNMPGLGAMWNSPWQWRLDREYEELTKPLRDLTRDLQDRLDEIPTSEQRQAAQDRMATKLAEKGFKD
jgi:hypothetical protein